MDHKRQQRQYLITIFAIIAIGIVAFGCFIFSEKNEQKKRDQKMAELTDEARVYEDKITEIEKLVKQKEKEISINVQTPAIVVAFYVENEQEVRSVLGIAERFIKDEKITFLLNPMIDIKENEKMLDYISEYAKNSYEIGIYGDVAEEGIAENYDSFENMLEGRGIKRSDFWFLSNDVNLSEYTQFLKDRGFAGYSKLTDYSIHINTGISGEFYYIEYLPVKVSNVKIKSTIELCIRENRTSVILFPMKDLAEIKYEDMDEVCKLAFTTIYDSAGKVEIRFPSEIYERMFEQDNLEKSRKEEYEIFRKEKEEEIQELKQKIDAIYDRWED